MGISTPLHVGAQAPWQVAIWAAKVTIWAPKVPVWAAEMPVETPVEVGRQLGLRGGVRRVGGVGARLNKRIYRWRESESKTYCIGLHHG